MLAGNIAMAAMAASSAAVAPTLPVRPTATLLPLPGLLLYQVMLFSAGTALCSLQI